MITLPIINYEDDKNNFSQVAVLKDGFQPHPSNHHLAKDDLFWFQARVHAHTYTTFMRTHTDHSLSL